MSGPTDVRTFTQLNKARKVSEEVLSQAEVESLLNAMESEASTQVHTKAEPPHALADASEYVVEKRSAMPYDFKRPERVGKEQMRALQSLHEGFSRNFGVALSGLLRTIAEVKLTSVDQLTYSEFVFSLENPTCFNLIKAEPLEGHLILDINPSILYPIIDRLLGGGKEETGTVARRPLTEIELRLVSRITQLFLDEMRRAWEAVLELDMIVEHVESNPQLVQIVPPNEVVVLISFEVTLGDVRGMLNLCIPFNSIERISSKLAANNWITYSAAEPTSDSIQKIGRQLNGSVVEVVVPLAESKLRTADLIGLRVGDIITTETDAESTLHVCVEGVPKFMARPGAHRGQKAVQIECPISFEFTSAE